MRASLLNLSEPARKAAWSKPALWSTLAAALVVTVGSLGPFAFRVTYGRFLYRHIRVYGMLYVTPHSLLHLVSFGLLGLLASLISTRWPVRGCAMAGLVLLGLGIEWIQFRSHPGNSFESWDWRNDAVGGCIGALLVYAWAAMRRPADTVSPL